MINCQCDTPGDTPHSITVEQPGYGVITLEPDEAIYNTGTSVKVSITMASHCTLAGWTGGTLSGTNTAESFVISSDVTIGANLDCRVAKNWTGVPGSGQGLKSVWSFSSNDIWAVGANGIIWHYNGIAWDNPSSGVTDNLNKVYAADAEHVWVAGANGTILFWDGTAWSAQTSGVSSNLSGLWVFDANNIWVCGSGNTLLYWDGTSWSPQDSGLATDYNAISGVDPQNLWLFGQSNGVIRRGLP